MAEVIGSRLERLIEERGTSQSAVARSIGLSQPSIGRLITGETRQTGKLLELARHLGTSPEYLVGETDDPSGEIPAEGGHSNLSPAAYSDAMSAGQIDVERLKDAMEAANLDQSGLARLIDATPGTVNQILTGRTKRSRYMPVIAQELNVSLSWLMKRSDNRDEPAAPRLSDDERRLLANFRRLTGAQQQAVMQILDGMVPSSTLHSKQHTYRAQG